MSLSAGAIKDLSIFFVAFNLLDFDQKLNEKEGGKFEILPDKIQEQFLACVNTLYSSLQLIVVNYASYAPRIKPKLNKAKGWGDDSEVPVNLVQIAVALLIENFASNNREKALAPELENLWQSVSKTVFTLSDILDDFGGEDVSEISSKMAFRLLERMK